MVRKTGYHVHHRAGRDQGGDRRAGRLRHAGRRGGAQQLCSGVAHFAADDEAAAFRLVKEILSLPAAEQQRRPAARVSPTTTRAAATTCSTGWCPRTRSEPYDMRQVIASVFDRGSFLEVHAHYAKNALVGLARLDGFPVGVVANQPMYLAGVLDIDSSRQDRPLRALLRRVQPADHHLRRLPRLSARRRAGARRHHPPRREDHLRLLRGDRAQDQRGHPQGHGRRLHRHEQQADAHRPGLRLADAPRSR